MLCSLQSQVESCEQCQNLIFIEDHFKEVKTPEKEKTLLELAHTPKKEKTLLELAQTSKKGKGNKN